MKLMVLNLIITGLAMMIMLTGFVLSKKLNRDMMKLSPFECGFISYENSRMPFSSQFFLIAIIFLIFDVEILLLFPYIYMNMSSGALSFFSLYLFLIILILGLFVEWSEGVLEWQK